MFFIAIGLTIITIAGLVSYIYRKPQGNWGVPKVAKQFNVGIPVIISIGLLAITFPLFGASLLLIIFFDFLKNKKAIKE